MNKPELKATAEPENRRTRRNAAQQEAEEAERAAVLALIPGDAGISYGELLQSAKVEAVELQEILDELEAAGLARRAVVNSALSYVRA